MTALRILGAVLVVFACGAWGFMQTARLRRRKTALAAVCKTLEQLRAEIVERRAPIREIAQQLLRGAPAPCRAWFAALADELDAESGAGFAVLWRRALETKAGLPLRGDELEQLCLLGLSLGRYDAPEQGAAIDRCMREMERAHARADEDVRIQGRLFSGLGLAAGALLAVVLL